MTHQTFELLGASEIRSLRVEVQEFRHHGTGARHFHLAADDDNNAFLVAFLTVPQDSTGVAHILEHTTLCGSQRYPVRDPFFMMIRRSLNTFMNAFTSSDWTAYPFATQNRKDFYNLLHVYLDSVFFPRLDPLDFAQEGHRVEFQRPDDPTSPLEFKGVVFNEMKGAMSSPISQLWQTVQSNLFPTTTYHYNSGGDPEAIPDLTYDALKAFHRRHYHPSNALFMTYGDLDVAEHHRVFDEDVLSRFEPESMDLAVPDERRFDIPQAVESAYTLDAEDGTRDKTHIVVGWLLGKTPEIREQMLAHLLVGVLLDNSSSPLRHALETSELGSSPSELCGLDDSNREMTLVCGLDGSNPELAEEVESLVLSVLEEVAENGVPQAQVESVLHQLELSQREIQSGGFPYGLRLMVNTLAPTLHGGDPVTMLDIDPILDELRGAIQDPRFVRDLVREKLLDNPHRLRVVMQPDLELAARRREQERARLAALASKLANADRDQVIALTHALEARQMADDDPEVLPRVGLEDVPATRKIAEGQSVPIGGLESHWYAAGTNGMVYQQAVIDVPTLEPDLVDFMPLFSDAVGEVGSAGRDYRATQARQAAVTGGVGARFSVGARTDDSWKTRTLFAVSAKALARNHEGMSQLLRETRESPRFDEFHKLRELVAESRAQREMSVTQHGHSLAMVAACAGLSPIGALSQRWEGLEGLRWLKQLDEKLDIVGEIEAFAGRLEALRDVIAACKPRLLLVGEAERRREIEAAANMIWSGTASTPSTAGFSPPSAKGAVRQGWATNTQVSFCAKAFAAVSQDHPDAAALTVLGPFLRNGYLHRAIREQGGAYGAGAGYDADTGAFRFFSYRDPRLEATLDDFDASVQWLSTGRQAARSVEEAILGVVGSIDRPNSPAGEAISAYFANAHGRTPEQRLRFRARVLQVSLDDLRRVGSEYLTPERASVAVISDLKTLENAGILGLDLIRL